MEWMPIVYWFVGVLSALIGLWLLPEPAAGQGWKEWSRKSWSSIDSLNFNTEFDAEFEKAVTAQDVAYILGNALYTKAGLLNFEVKPGKYSVEARIITRFVERDKPIEEDESKT